MKIGVFAYNFPHWKTQQGLFNLLVNNLKPEAVFLQNWMELNLPPSEDISPKGLYLLEPYNVSNALGIICSYKVEHNSDKCKEFIKWHNLDIGIILGARILKEEIINAFNMGVINMHPGILPQNRGLDNIIKAKQNDWEQGVTVHWIDKYVDRGTIIKQEIIPDGNKYTAKELHIMIQNLEQKMMIEVLDELCKIRDIYSEMQRKCVSAV